MKGLDVVNRHNGILSDMMVDFVMASLSKSS